MRLVIGLFKVNTQATQYLSAASRVENVRIAVEKTRFFTENLGTTFWKDLSAIRAIFLAPEYCFARSLPNLQGDHTFGTKRQMDEDYVRDKLRPVFGQLSNNFKNGLIVPGSVAWRKSIRPADKGQHQSIQAREAYRRNKYQQRLLAGANINLDEQVPFTQHTPVFPTAYKSPLDTRANLPSTADKSNWLQTAHYIAKNTAHCYYNGDCVYKYNKIGDFYEVSEDNTDVVMVPNKSTVSGTTGPAGRFMLGQYTFGISICYDQSLSVQQQGNVTVREPMQWTSGPVDIHILLSAHISPNMYCNYITNGGVLLSCSSMDDCNKVLLSSGTEVPPDRSESINGVGLDLYVLEA
jgi:hypothetical protein